MCIKPKNQQDIGLVAKGLQIGRGKEADWKAELQEEDSLY